MDQVHLYNDAAKPTMIQTSPDFSWTGLKQPLPHSYPEFVAKLESLAKIFFHPQQEGIIFKLSEY